MHELVHELQHRRAEHDDVERGEEEEHQREHQLHADLLRGLLGALPARFRRERVLIVGCGDVGMRMLPLLRDRFRIFAVTSQPARCAELRAAGADIVADEVAAFRNVDGNGRKASDNNWRL